MTITAALALSVVNIKTALHRRGLCVEQLDTRGRNSKCGMSLLLHTVSTLCSLSDMLEL